MKLHILSDLHLGFAPLDLPANDADVVILAGDIARSREAAAWAQRFVKPVLYVLGNHEFYGSSIDGAAAELEQLCAGTHVHVLDNRELIIGKVLSRHHAVDRLQAARRRRGTGDRDG